MKIGRIWFCIKKQQFSSKPFVSSCQIPNNNLTTSEQKSWQRTTLEEINSHHGSFHAFTKAVQWSPLILITHIQTGRANIQVPSQRPFHRGSESSSTRSWKALSNLPSLGKINKEYIRNSQTPNHPSQPKQEADPRSCAVKFDGPVYINFSSYTQYP